MGLVSGGCWLQSFLEGEKGENLSLWHEIIHVDGGEIWGVDKIRAYLQKQVALSFEKNQLH